MTVALTPALIICLSLSLYFILLRYNEAEVALLERGTALARQLAPAAEYGVFSGNLNELQRLAEAVAREPDVTAISFFDLAGQPLARVGQVRFQHKPDDTRDHWQELSTDGKTLFFISQIQRPLAAFEDAYSSLSALPPAATQLLGTVVVEVSRASVIASKREFLAVSLLVVMTALLTGILSARRLSRDVTEPIKAMELAVNLIQRGRLNTRIAIHAGGALQGLEQGINTMAAALESGRDQLEQRIIEATSELRQKKEEAEHTSQAKSRFLAAASHDLRQPLHALSLFIDALEAKLTTAAQRQTFSQVQAATQALREQLNSMLDVSRLDLGDVIKNLENLPLDPLIERVVAVHALEAEAKGLRLRHVQTRAHTYSDPRLLERMLGNLLANAVRYTERGGIVIGVRHLAQGYRLEVWDSGIGISSDQLPLIFQEFYQVDNPERGADKGLGLGLSIVSRLAQILEHPVSVRSTPGQGTVFSVQLPQAPRQNDMTATPALGSLAALPHDMAATFAVDVLVLEADDSERKRLLDLLQNWGCRPLGLSQADEVAAALAELEPAVVIFTAAFRQAVMALCASRPRPPCLLQLGTEPAKPPVPGQTSTAEHAEPALTVSQLSLPWRPARLRALLQQQLQVRNQDQAQDGEPHATNDR